jgi:hypothetical protein
VLQCGAGPACPHADTEPGPWARAAVGPARGWFWRLVPAVRPR